MICLIKVRIRKSFDSSIILCYTSILFKIILIKKWIWFIFLILSACVIEMNWLVTWCAIINWICMNFYKWIIDIHDLLVLITILKIGFLIIRNNKKMVRISLSLWCLIFRLYLIRVGYQIIWFSYYLLHHIMQLWWYCSSTRWKQCNNYNN